MENILLIFVCMLLGFGFRRTTIFPPFSYKVLNQFVIYISLPSIALYYIPKLMVSSKLLYPLGIAWLGFVFSFAFFSILGKLFGWSKKMIGCLVIVAGLGNTSFVGYPVIEALYGKEALQTAVIVDQPGSFVVVSTLVILIASMYSRTVSNSNEVLKKIILFPPFIAFALSVVLNIMHLDFPLVLQSVFQRLGSTVTPIALVAVGMQLEFDGNSKHWRFLFLGLFFKLILTPLFFYLLYVVVLKANGLDIKVSILESAMAPMITGAIVAVNYGLKPKLAIMMIGFGIPLSFLTLIFWYYVLKFI